MLSHYMHVFVCPTAEQFKIIKFKKQIEIIRKKQKDKTIIYWEGRNYITLQ